jgi:hypothetical protein
MNDEPSDEDEVEGHVRHGGGHGMNEEPSDEADNDDEVEAHVRKI